MPARRPAPNGVLDQRLGVADKTTACRTCNKKVTECAGHFGHVEFQLPLFHIGFFKHTLTICQCICKSCSAILLSANDREFFLRKLRKPSIDALMKASIFKKIIEKCKKSHRCERCGAFNGPVKKISNVATLKLAHEKFKGKQAEPDHAALHNNLKAAMAYNQELAQHLHKAQEDLSPVVVLELFKQITDEDCELLWMDPTVGRPENLLLSAILVPPVPIRPSVAMDTGAGSNEDDLTVKMQEILGVNNALREAFNKGATVKMMVVDWNFLQVQVAQYINGEMPGLSKPMGEKQPIRGLCQRLKGKSGRFRGNLSGKRVDFSARTVISPDPNLRIDQVGVPVRVAMTMTFPDRVSRYNIDCMRKLVRNGPMVHPGANYIRSGSVTKSLMYGNRSDHAANLQIGDVVERHMLDDDVVLFNRQPSLHKLSIMAHRVKVMSWRTFRFNECVCAPYNADFDGDEMNMHLPQTEEARAEAALLMAVPQNIVTPRNGEPLIAGTQDFLTASYLITQKDVFFDREAFCRLVSTLGDGNEHIDMPLPAILKPTHLWTGKQVMSLLVRPNRACKVRVNLELEEKNYTENGPACIKDGYVVFRNSELLAGNLAKKTLGDGSKKGLFYVLLKDHGFSEAARCMNRIAKLCANYMGNRGFSIGIEDVTPAPRFTKEKDSLLLKGYSDADANISAFQKGRLELKPGCDAVQSLEDELCGILSKVRESAGKMAMKELPWSNAPRIMAECGSKGSPLNISQMIACIGQIAVDGKRIQNGFVKRTLPHFKTDSLVPGAKGFVANSFYTGLTATEFFFHTMAGREGLVDTAVKTAQTGYMARRLMKALEDLSMHYDKTVRNSEGTVVQFSYGSDGLDPACMEGMDRPVNLPRVLKNIRATIPRSEAGPMISHDEICRIIKEEMSGRRFTKLLPEGIKFLEEVEEFLQEKAAEVEAMCKVFKVDLSQDVPSVESHDDERRLRTVLYGIAGITKLHLEKFLETVLNKYSRSVVEPGEAIGALGAQSISEPGTQMTLRTFHFAGVASMNVTLGVPRLTEIINASKVISTPIITAQLVQNDNEYTARLVKGKIEKTTLGQISKSITEVYAPESCYITVTLDLEKIEKLKLEIDAERFVG
jgi:DNA-directed RNA polymerase III subunit RPC1